MVMRPCNSDVTRAWNASTSHPHVFARQCLVVRGRRGVIVPVTTAEALTMIGGFAAADELVRLERELILRVTGVRVGHLVSVGGVRLKLSDGQRLPLGGASRRGG
jgi:hypothetical protein